MLNETFSLKSENSKFRLQLDFVLFCFILFSSSKVYCNHLYGARFSSLQGIVTFLLVCRRDKFHRHSSLVVRVLLGYKRSSQSSNQLDIKRKSLNGI